jgi:endonuclease/exonuclease/phosphatase family metal-dependent hydrolase
MLRVINTHLGLRGGERAEQIARLLASVVVAGPTVILGDFNEWRWRAPNLAPLERVYAGTPALRSFPARRPLLALDRVFVHPREALVGSQLVATEEARRASDHLPIRSILKLDAPPSGVLQPWASANE